MPRRLRLLPLGHTGGNPNGQIMFMLILSVAAAESGGWTGFGAAGATTL